MIVQPQQNLSDKKKQLQKERLEKRRQWRIDNRKKPKQEERKATVDEYKRTLQGEQNRGWCNWLTPI